MEVSTINQCDIGVDVPERSRGLEPSETSSHDDNAWALGRRPGLFILTVCQRIRTIPDRA